MPAVFVHGNPETAVIWDPLLSALERKDTICLSPPGFGAPVPEGFGCTRLDYGEWLIDALEAIDGPIDLVGHDWGGGHVLHVAMNRPDLLASWASDVLGLLSPEYVWHDAAQLWQTPGAGEEMVAAMTGGTAADRAALLEASGLGAEVAQRLAPGIDAVMGASMLALYRSAVQPAMADLGVDLPKASARPGLALLAENDPYLGAHEPVYRSAAAAGARVVPLADVGHWWMLDDPEQGARALTEFWAAN
jgi:pimeloyl-ACP methyl ester carboxylesterase